MEDIILEFFRNEVISDYKCDKCNRKEKIIKTNEIIKFPRILIINVKRFIHYPVLKKLNNRIAIEEEIDLKDFFVDPKYDKSREARKYMQVEKNNGVYELRSFVEHHGEIDYGHYVSYCKNDKVNDWVLFNDERAQKIRNDDFFDDCDKGVYILFYEMK